MAEDQRPATVAPLHGVRVVELCPDLGAFAGRMLGELGAEVIRVESPGGDAIRHRRPFLAGEAGIERSLHHLHFNAYKRSVLLELGSEHGIAALHRLVGSADMLLDALDPGERARLGLGGDEVARLHPGLIHVSVSPFHPQGPFAGFAGNDLTGVASSGLMYLNGYAEDPPQRPGAEQGYHMASLVAVTGSLLALVGRERNGGSGPRVEVSMQEAASMATLQTANANIYAWHGRVPRRNGQRLPGQAGSIYRCRDGRWISFVIPLGAPALWRAYVEWMREEGIGEAYDDPRWDDPAFRAQHSDETRRVIERLCERYDRGDLFLEGQRRRMLVMPLNDASDLLSDPHLRERDYFTTVRHEELGVTLTDAGPPYRFRRTPARRDAVAPVLGQDTAELLEGLPRAPAERPTVARPDALPLDGVRVADFFWLIAGPSTSRVFSDFGADVIKIESQSRVDNIRTIGVQPTEPGSIDTNGVFADCNTGKRSVTLNLNHPRGIELAKELVRHSDVVTNNFTGDRMDRWGLGYEDLKRVKPDIIMLTMPVMGTSGPYRRFGSYGNGVIAYGGLAMNMGLPGRDPVGIAPLYSDFSTPYVAASAILAALHHRARTGEGQFIELAQAEATVALLGTDIIEYSANGTIAPLLGNRSRDQAPHGAFRCAGEDRWCAIAARDDGEWERLARAIEREDLTADPALATLSGRQAREDELEAAIGAWTADRDAWEVMRALQAAGVAAAVVEDLADLAERDPWMSTHHLVPVTRGGNAPVFTTHSQPIWLDGASPTPRPHPRFGEHNEEVYRDLLGLTDGDIASLVAEGVLQ